MLVVIWNCSTQKFIKTSECCTSTAQVDRHSNKLGCGGLYAWFLIQVEDGPLNNIQETDSGY